MRIFAIIGAAVVFILGPGYYLVGYNVVSPLDKAAKEAALRPNISESDLYETGTVTKDDRASIATSVPFSAWMGFAPWMTRSACGGLSSRCRPPRRSDRPAWELTFSMKSSDYRF